MDLKSFIENHATPLACAGAVAAYQYGEANYPLVADLAGSLGLNEAVITGLVVSLMAMGANYLSRRWSKWLD